MARPPGPRRHGRVRETAASWYAPAAPAELTGVVLDSDVIIEILRDRTPAVRAAVALEATGVPTFCTAVSWAEVYAGVRVGEEAVTQAFFDARGEVVLERRVGRLAGEYLGRHRRSHGVEIADALVAAAAVTSGSRLWTLNRKHYPKADLHFYVPSTGNEWRSARR
jgi:predicted nucleic acid-binding protein